jgi:hypothetical protein
MPGLINFLSLEEVKQEREMQNMSVDDRDANIKQIVGLGNCRSNLTPRGVDGQVNELIASTRVLPPHVNPRTGWKKSLEGQPDQELVREMKRESIVRQSVLRDRDGYKDKKIEKYNDRGITSDFAKINRIPQLSQGRDGSGMLLDCKEAVYRIGAPNKRQVHHQHLRSAYDCYSCSGEPLVTASLPPMKLFHSSDCLDYIFYSQGALVPSKVLSLPSWQGMRRGENPELSQAASDPCFLSPFPRSRDMFDIQLQRLLGRSDNNSNSRSESSYTMQEVNKLKRQLKVLLQKSYGSNQNAGNAQLSKRSQGRSVSKNKSLSQGLGQLNADYAFYGGRWAHFAVHNPARNNYYLPNSSFASSHFALGVDFLVDSDFLATTYTTN